MQANFKFDCRALPIKLFDFKQPFLVGSAQPRKTQSEHIGPGLPMADALK